MTLRSTRMHALELNKWGQFYNFHVERLQADPEVLAPGNIWYNTTEKTYKCTELDPITETVVVKYFNSFDRNFDAPLPLGWKMIQSPLTYQIADTDTPIWIKLSDKRGVYSFPDDKDKTVNILLPLPRDYKIGTKIYPAIHWAPASISSGISKWDIEYIISNPYIQNSLIDKTPIIIPIDMKGSGQLYKHRLAVVDEAHGFIVNEEDSIINLRLTRNGQLSTDTFIGDIITLSLALIYQSENESSQLIHKTII